MNDMPRPSNYQTVFLEPGVGLIIERKKGAVGEVNTDEQNEDPSISIEQAHALMEDIRRSLVPYAAADNVNRFQLGQNIISIFSKFYDNKVNMVEYSEKVPMDVYFIEFISQFADFLTRRNAQEELIPLKSLVQNFIRLYQSYIQTLVFYATSDTSSTRELKQNLVVEEIKIINVFKNTFDLLIRQEDGQ